MLAYFFCSFSVKFWTKFNNRMAGLKSNFNKFGGQHNTPTTYYVWIDNLSIGGLLGKSLLDRRHKVSV
jgi:hypothetical protein